MSLTYIAKDLAEIAKDFHDKATYQLKISNGVIGNYPAKDRKEAGIRAVVWELAANQLDHTEIRGE